MAIDFSALAYAFHQRCKSASLPLKLSQVQQLTAAVLGYKSLAAYQAAIATGSEPVFLDAAEHVALASELMAVRAHQLGIPNPEQPLAPIAKAAFQDCLPDATVHWNEVNFFVHIQEDLERAVEADEETANQMALTNSDGVDEVYVPVDSTLASLPPAATQVTLPIDGHVAMVPDTERLYSGHIIKVQAQIQMNRMGYTLFSDIQNSVLQAKLDYGWADAAHEDQGPKISLSHAISELTGLDESEVEQLVDVEPMPIEGSDDAVYGYILDFTRYAPPEIAEMLMEKHGRLDFRVGLNFFDRVQST